MKQANSSTQTIELDAGKSTRRRLSAATNVLGPLLGLLAVISLFGVLDKTFGNDTFLSWQNFRTVSAQTCVVAVVALGMTAIVISGGIDLSAGTAIALCATVFAWGLREDVGMLVTQGETFRTTSRALEEAKRGLQAAQRKRDPAAIRGAEEAVARQRADVERILTEKIEHLRLHAKESGEGAAGTESQREMQAKLARLADPKQRLQLDGSWWKGVPNASWTPWLSLALGISAGVLAGLVNGGLISTLRVAPFIVTLGTMMLYLGLGKLIPETPVRPDAAQTPRWIPELVQPQPDTEWLMVASGVWLALLLAGALSLALRYTVFGRYVFALGSNEATARLCGIRVPLVKLWVYGLAGFFVGVGGVYHFARLTEGDPTSGTGKELDIIAAVVIGGASLSGGRGSVLGTLTGAAIMGVIRSGGTHLGLTNAVQDIILGVIIVAAVTLDQYRQRRLADE